MSEPSATPAPEPKENIYIVASKSFCTATGVDDIYTGDGHVQFFLTLKNSGGADGSLSMTPVRYYDDGTDNRSPLDEVTADVAAHELWKGKTQAFKYEAHEHDVVRCALVIDGGEEVEIKAIHL
jgi:hypothetical protein